MLNNSAKKCIIIFIGMIITLITLSCFSGDVTAIKIGDTVNLGESVWKSEVDGNDIYCIQRGVDFSGNTGTVTSVVDLSSSKEKADIAAGYILTKRDTLLSDYEISQLIKENVDYLASNGWSRNGVTRFLENGIYDITSTVQNAIWAIKSDRAGVNLEGSRLDQGFKEATYWESSTRLVYQWSLTTGSEPTDHAWQKVGNNFKMENSNFSLVSIPDKNYYSQGLQLYKEAVNFAKNYDFSNEYLEDKTVGTPQQDYSNDNYIFIGPYNVSVSSQIESVVFKDGNNNNINSGIGLFRSKNPNSRINNISNWNGGNFYIGIQKSGNIPTMLKSIEFTCKKQVISGKLIYISCSSNQNLVSGDVELKDNSVTIKIELNQKLVPPIQIILNKVDVLGNKLNGVKFKVTYSNGLSSETKTTGTNGKIEFSQRRPTNLNEFTATIEEENAKTGYKLLEKSIILKFSYNAGKWDVTKIAGSAPEAKNVQVTQKDGITKAEVEVVNEQLIEKLTVLKTNRQDGTKIQGAKFTIKLSNIKSIGKYSSGSKSGNITLTNVTTDSNGNIVLEDLVINNSNEEIKIEIEETEATIGYKIIEGKITVTLKRTGVNSYTISSSKENTVLDSEFKEGEATVNSQTHQVSLNIKNIPIMNLGGIVWEDTQTGDKKVEEPDGKLNNSEKGISGVEVQVYKADGEKVEKDMYGNNLMTKTAKSGEELQYKIYNGETKTVTLEEGEYIFPNLENGTNYYVEFTYDGINYKTVNISNNKYSITTPKESKVEEVGRSEFNEKFKTISDSTTVDTASKSYATATTLGKNLEYDKQSETNGIITSKLKTTQNGIANNEVLSDYQMKAKASNYLNKASDWKETWTSKGEINRNSYALDINCGLTYKFFDLAIGMDISEARLTVNEKETKYGYNQILDGDLSDINLNDVIKELTQKQQDDVKLDKLVDNNISKNRAEEKGKNYNLYLYTSDYYYRITDYRKDGAINNQLNEDDNESIVISDTGEELKAYVTYKVVIKNQSTVNSAKVNQIAYYYDRNYEINQIKDAQGNILYARNAQNNVITFRENGTAMERNVAIVEGFATNLDENNDYRQELYFEFEVKKDTDRNLPEEILTGEGLKCANIVEILSYSTDDGLVDNDSCPGNVVGTGYEDDTDEAPGINISIKNEERNIKGTVWNDINKDGKIEDGEEAINDVIVQLIEIKKIDGKFYEYIWQETRSGPKDGKQIVKMTTRNGYTGQNYENNEIQNGEYQFRNFIPGNYIIRFIYGDGSTYDVTDTNINKEKIKQYNGQDYQSTIDLKYKSSWYNNAEYGEDIKSVARDNEARRLEVMAYSAMIDETKGQELEIKTDEMLQGTWMAAETSRINVPVDTENNQTIQNNTAVSFSYENKIVEFKDIGLGLVKRPETKLILEKHITALRITPSGTGVQSIIDASANIKDILNGSITTIGVKEGLTTIKSERGERGFWKVETDIEELAQGATLEVEYTYVIKNESEENYLNENLINLYQDNISQDANNNEIDDYTEIILPDLKSTVKAAMRSGSYAYSDDNKIGEYLGEYYYTGTKGNGDALVTSRVEELEEGINNDLKYNSEISGNSFTKVNTAKEIRSYIDMDGNFEKDAKEIETIIKSTSPSNFLKLKEAADDIDKYTDYGKTIKLTTVLSSMTNGETGGNYQSYLTEIAKYSNAAGRRSMEAEPGNLSYVDSEDTEVTLDNAIKYDYENGSSYISIDGLDAPAGAIKSYKLNEEDEFWGETIIITKPTGEDKISAMQITITIASSLAVLGIGIVLIKRYVLKK